jgi:ubiquinone/menaquinone biosynthesis C-methylase UbiE
MKRAPLAHDRVFSDEAAAEAYARGHNKMAERFGVEYARKLSARGFRQGRILDVGCGSGAMNLVLARRFPDSEIVGIDLSEPLLRLAREGAEAANLGERVRFERADVQEIPYDDDSFDVVINTNMVHLVEDPVRMLDEMERVLVPGGFLFIADLRRSWLGFFEREIRSALTLPEARKLFSRSRLREGFFAASMLWWRFETQTAAEAEASR